MFFGDSSFSIKLSYQLSSTIKGLSLSKQLHQFLRRTQQLIFLLIVLLGTGTLETLVELVDRKLAVLLCELVLLEEELLRQPVVDIPAAKSQAKSEIVCGDWVLGK